MILGGKRRSKTQIKSEEEELKNFLPETSMSFGKKKTTGEEKKGKYVKRTELMVIPRPSRGPLKCMRVEAKEQNKGAKKAEVVKRKKDK